MTSETKIEAKVENPAAFTGGDWEIVTGDAPDRWGHCEVCSIYGAADVLIIGPRRQSDMGSTAMGEEAVANSKLLRAAPDMYAALVRLESFLDSGAFPELQQVVSAALSKARGNP